MGMSGEGRAGSERRSRLLVILSMPTERTTKSLRPQTGPLLEALCFLCKCHPDIVCFSNYLTLEWHTHQENGPAARAQIQAPPRRQRG